MEYRKIKALSTKHSIYSKPIINKSTKEEANNQIHKRFNSIDDDKFFNRMKFVTHSKSIKSDISSSSSEIKIKTASKRKSKCNK